MGHGLSPHERQRKCSAQSHAAVHLQGQDEPLRDFVPVSFPNAINTSLQKHDEVLQGSNACKNLTL